MKPLTNDANSYKYEFKNGKMTYYDNNDREVSKSVFEAQTGYVYNSDEKKFKKVGATETREVEGVKLSIVKDPDKNFKDSFKSIGTIEGLEYGYRQVGGGVIYYVLSGENYIKIDEKDFQEATGKRLRKSGTELKVENAPKPKIDKSLGRTLQNFGNGALKNIKSMFTDENGNFSWKQTLKTVGTCVAITAAAALLVAAEVFTAGQVTWFLVGAGAVMGTVEIGTGAYQMATATNQEEYDAGGETTGSGAFDLAVAALMRKGIKSSLGTAQRAGRAAKVESLISGSGKNVARMRAAWAGIKSTAPAPKDIVKGLKESGKTLKKNTQTTLDSVRHPKKAWQKAQANRAKVKQAKTQVETKVKGVETQEDIVATRAEIEGQTNVSENFKTKQLKKLDKKAQKAGYENLKEARGKTDDIYENALKKSLDEKGLKTEKANLENVERSDAFKDSSLDELNAKVNDRINNGSIPESDEALIAGIKKNTKLTAEQKADLIKQLEDKNIKGSPEFQKKMEQHKIIEDRLAELDRAKANQLESEINQLTTDDLNPSLTKKIFGRGKKTRKLEHKIETEIKDPELKQKLLNKLEAKRNLIDTLKETKHLKKHQFEDLINKADDEESLKLLEKRLGTDHKHTNKRERSKLYRQLFRKQHEINPTKYPDVSAIIADRKYTTNIKAAKKELETANKALKEARRNADPEKVIKEHDKIVDKLNEQRNKIETQHNEIIKNKNLSEQERTQRLEELDKLKKELAKKQQELEQATQSSSTSGKNYTKKELKAKKKALKASYETDNFSLRVEKRYKEGLDGLATRQKELVSEIFKDKQNGTITPEEVATKIQNRRVEVQKELEHLQKQLKNSPTDVAKEFYESEIKLKKAEIKQLDEFEALTKERNIEDGADAQLLEDVFNEKINKDLTSLKEHSDGYKSLLEKDLEDIHTELNELENVTPIKSKTPNETEVKLQKEIEQLNKDISSKTKEIKNIDGKIKDFESKIKAKEAELEKLNAKKNPDQKRIAKLKREISELKEKHDEYVTQLRNARKDFASAKKKVDELNKAHQKVKPAHKFGASLAGVVGVNNLYTAVSLAGNDNNVYDDEFYSDDVEDVTEDEDIGVSDSDDVEEIDDDDTVAEPEAEEIPDDDTEDTETPDGASGNDGEAQSGAGNTTPETPTAPDNSSQDGNGTPSAQSGNDTPAGTPTPETPTVPNGSSQGGNGTPEIAPERETTPASATTPAPVIYNTDPNYITATTYVTGRSESGDKREITPAERMIITKQIDSATTLADIALLYTEVRSFKHFNGRKNILRAIKQKRKEIEHKSNHYERSINKVKDSQIYQEAQKTVQESDMQAVTHTTSDVGDVTVSKEHGFGRLFHPNTYVLNNTENEKITLNTDTPTPEPQAPQASTAEGVEPANTENSTVESQEGTTETGATEGAEQANTETTAGETQEGTATTGTESEVASADATEQNTSADTANSANSTPQADPNNTDYLMAEKSPFEEQPEDYETHKLDIDEWGNYA
jgi:hypothetical protein